MYSRRDKLLWVHVDSLLQPLVSSTCRPCAGQLPVLMIAKERREVAGVHVRVHIESPGDLLHDWVLTWVSHVTNHAYRVNWLPSNALAACSNLGQRVEILVGWLDRWCFNCVFRQTQREFFLPHCGCHWGMEYYLVGFPADIVISISTVQSKIHSCV